MPMGPSRKRLVVRLAALGAILFYWVLPYDLWFDSIPFAGRVDDVFVSLWVFFQFIMPSGKSGGVRSG